MTSTLAPLNYRFSVTEPGRSQGPRKHCPMCERLVSNDSMRACEEGKVITPKRWFKSAVYCMEHGHHLHQSCERCGARWVTDPAEEAW